VGHLLGGTWFNIKRLLKLNWKVKICHSYRETNFGTNVLVNSAYDSDFTMILYEQCPAKLVPIIS